MASSSDPRGLTGSALEEMHETSVHAVADKLPGEERDAVERTARSLVNAVLDAGYLDLARDALAARASSPAPDARAIEAADAALSFLSAVEELLHHEGADDGLGSVLTQLEAVASSPVPEDDRIEKAVGLLNAARIGAECTGQHGSVQLFGELIEILTAAPVSVGDGGSGLSSGGYQ